MKALDNDRFIKTYGIDDENFLNFIGDGNFETFKSLCRYYNTDIISKKDMETVYNRYIYCKSVGLDDKTTDEVLNNLYRGIIHKLNGKKIKITEYNKDYVKLAANGLYCAFTFLDDLAIVNLDVEILQEVTTSPFEFIFNVPIPEGTNMLFVPNSLGGTKSCDMRIYTTGDIKFTQSTPVTTGRLKTSVAYKYR